VIGPPAGTVGILAGPPDFASLYERAMPQKDQLCGAFWGSLILSATGHTASQEEVALRAGSALAEGDPVDCCRPALRPGWITWQPSLSRPMGPPPERQRKGWPGASKSFREAH
jgi:hypothetical protein